MLPLVVTFAFGTNTCHDINSSRSDSTMLSYWHYGDVIMGAMLSQISSLTIVYSTVYSGADQRKHQSSASLAFVRGIHRWPVKSPHKWPVTRGMFLFDDVMILISLFSTHVQPCYSRCERYEPNENVDISTISLIWIFWPKQNDSYIVDGIFKCNILNENYFVY